MFFKRFLLTVLCVFIMIGISYAANYEYQSINIENRITESHDAFKINDINDNGLVLGTFRVAPHEWRFWIYNINTDEFSIYQRVGAETSAAAGGINNNNEVNGWFPDLDHPDPSTHSDGRFIFDIDANEWIVFPAVDPNIPDKILRTGPSGRGDINDSGIMVGHVYFPTGPPTRGWIDENGIFTYFSYNPATYFYFYSINNIGFVIGSNAVLYNYLDDTYEIITHPEYSLNLRGINDVNQITGNTNNIPFVYENGDVTLLDGFSYNTTNPIGVGIDNTGKVAIHDGSYLVLATPILDVTKDYSPKVFKLMIRDSESHFLTSGTLETPEGLDLTDGREIEVDMVIIYKDLKSDGGDLIIQYNDIHIINELGSGNINIE